MQTYNTRIFITLLVLPHFDPQQDLLNLRWCWPPEDNVLTLEVKLFLFYLQEVLNLNWIWNYPRPFFCHLYLATKSLVMIAKERYTWKKLVVFQNESSWHVVTFFVWDCCIRVFFFFHKLVGSKRWLIFTYFDWEYDNLVFFSFINWLEVRGDLFLHILTENMIIWFSFLS